jgi:hypothetical protein
MIFLDSRYADGRIFKVYDSRADNYQLSVRREWPSYAHTYFTYEWIATDRLDNIATRFLGNPEMWWKILDINPEILNPMSIAPGTQLRIPNA